MDVIMTFAVGIFFILFAFLAFIFVTFFFSFFKQHTLPDFTPAVSVIIPCYNEEKTLSATLSALFRSEYEGTYEVIVVDDGSTDNSLDITKTYPVRIVQQAHKGKTEALNLGVKEAKHEIVFTIDADTLVDKDCLAKIVKPLQLDDVGGTSGSCRVQNKKNIITTFQNVEYHYNNLIRYSFSNVFNTGIWFFGAMAAYKKSVLDALGGFKKDTLTEDTDIALEIHQNGLRTVNVHDALGHTVVPDTMRGLYAQRKRWWMGVLQSLHKNKTLFSHKSSPSILFLFVNQYWWTVYAFISFPIILYQVYYWFPQGTVEAASYLFRWFSIVGPFYVLYKIPEWGISLFNIFGVLSGVMSLILILFSLKTFKERLSLGNILAIVFYFPYTIFLNLLICFSVMFNKDRYFIK